MGRRAWVLRPRASRDAGRGLCPPRCVCVRRAPQLPFLVPAVWAQGRVCPWFAGGKTCKVSTSTVTAPWGSLWRRDWEDRTGSRMPGLQPGPSVTAGQPAGTFRWGFCHAGNPDTDRGPLPIPTQGRPDILPGRRPPSHWQWLIGPAWIIDACESNRVRTAHCRGRSAHREVGVGTHTHTGPPETETEHRREARTDARRQTDRVTTV